MITVLVSPDCPQCRKLKLWLDAEDIGYDMADVTTPDGLALAAYHEVIGHNLPIVLTDDGGVMEGDPAEIFRHILDARRRGGQ